MTCAVATSFDSQCMGEGSCPIDESPRAGTGGSMIQALTEKPAHHARAARHSKMKGASLFKRSSARKDKRSGKFAGTDDVMIQAQTAKLPHHARVARKHSSAKKNKQLGEVVTAKLMELVHEVDSMRRRT